MRLVGKLASLAAVVSLAVVAGLASPDEAQSYDGTGSPYQSLRSLGAGSQYADELKGFLTGNNSTADSIYSAQSASTKGKLSTILYRGRVAGRFLPRVLPIATKLSLAGTALYIGYRIVQHYTDGSTVTVDTRLDSAALGKDLLINPQTVPSTYGGALNFQWAGVLWVKESSPTICGPVGTDDCFRLNLYPQYCSSSSVWQAPSFCAGGGTREWVDFPVSAIASIDGVNGWVKISADWDDCQATAQITGCIGSGQPASRQGLQWLLTRQAEALPTGTVAVNGTITRVVEDFPGTGAGTVQGYQILVPDTTFGGEQLEAHDGAVSSPDITADYNVPSSAGETDEDVQNIVDHFETVCGRSFLNAIADPSRFSFPTDCYLDPPDGSMAAPDTLEIPAPDVDGEGYSAYVNRVRNAGWEGAATKTTLPSGSEVPELPPGAVVTVAAPAYSLDWETLAWPDPGPEVESDDALTITVNPGVFVSPDPVEPGAGTALFPLPQPFAGETAAQYRTRLREQGHLGSIIIEDADPGDLPAVGQPQFNPLEPVRITVGSPSPTIIEIAAPWPDTPPTVSTDDPVVITQAPPATTPREATDPIPGGLDAPEASCEPWLEASPDFSPLQGLDFGEAFPFALFGWAGAILGPFSAAPDAPSWDFHIVIPATAVTDETDLGHFVVDLDWADSYMSTVRTILTFVLWIGAVWFFATSLLGFRVGSNPAEAVDEA